MSYVDIKTKFHCALDGQGLILQGAPERLVSAYEQAQAPVYGQRFASGDRSYNDLSQWWYFTQTDWSGGFKDSVAWLDDAKYYFSTNIDTFSEPGSIKLMSDSVLENDFTEEIVCGSHESPGAAVYPYVGTNPSGSTKPAIYRKNAGTWSNISSVFMPTTQQSVMDVMAHKGRLWFITMDITSGGTYEVGYCVDDGSSPTDLSANLSVTPRHCYSMDSDGANMYVSYRGSAALQGSRIDKSADNGATFSNVVNLATDGARIVCVRIVGGILYYLVTKPSGVEFWKLESAVNTMIWSFRGASLGNSSFSKLGDNDQSSVRGASMSRKGLLLLNGKIVITLQNEIWEWSPSGGTMNRMYNYNTTKNTIDASNRSAVLVGNFLNLGGVNHDNKLWWDNLVYDGTYFYNTKRVANDETSHWSQPVFSNGSTIYWAETGDFTKLYVESAYKGTADKNYVVLNNFDIVAGVDKLAYSATILFKPLISGQKISIEYFVGELDSGSTWVSLGDASYTIDGGVVINKTFFFGSSVIYNKIWFRIKLEGGGSDTPTMNDIVMEYLPMPTYKKTWTLNVNCADSMKMLNGLLAVKTGRELKSRLEVAWWTKSLIDYQDMDYSTTILNGSHTATVTTFTVDSTAEFPEQGRLKVDDEEIFYTAKTPTTFTGVIRGARGTRAVAHSDNAVINNAYKVIITNLSTRVPIALQGDHLEYIVSLALREA